MCGIGIIHHQDSEFSLITIPIQFQTILTEMPPLTLTKKTIPIPTLTGVRVSPRSESFSCWFVNKYVFKSDKHNSVVYLLSYFYVKTLFDSQGTKIAR